MNENNKLTHGLLLEDFKQNLLNLISQHALDVQSKSLVLDYVNTQLQNLSQQQTQKELAEYRKEQEEITKKETEVTQNNKNNKSKKASE
ncbi:MAG: hypothetical protein J1D87_08220 [Lachnospiraceae bacterium]|nr:hypothetical protein [Lachnospiraceae bacterium]